MTGESVLIVSTNWIGDAIMSMPAVQLFRQKHPDAKITMLARPLIRSLWAMHPAVDQLETMAEKFPTIRILKKTHFDRAYIFPNSFRSAFVPFMSGIPKRIGARGHWRRFMLTDMVSLPDSHQQFESMKILDVQGEPPAPKINVPEESLQSLKVRLTHQGFQPSGRPIITLLPGAARGPSKRWPITNFMAVAKKLRDDFGARILLGGGPDDAVVCDEIATATGPDAISVAGKTSIAEWAALLKMSDCVISNDSGGMHLAATVGTPVVGIFGITDPSKTGPLGNAVILQKSNVRARNIARESEEATLALASIQPDEVYEAATQIIGDSRNASTPRSSFAPRT